MKLTAPRPAPARPRERLPEPPPLPELLALADEEQPALARRLREAVTGEVTREKNARYLAVMAELLPVLGLDPGPPGMVVRSCQGCCEVPEHQATGPWWMTDWGEVICCRCIPPGVHSFLPVLDLGRAVRWEEVERVLEERER